jgi:hypothetical protein
MRKSMLMMLAMSAMMGAGMGMPRMEEPRRYRPNRKPLTPEEEAKLLEERQAKFMADLEKHNANRKVNFPKFKEHIVYGLPIIAHSPKNAVRDMNSLMRQNLIQVKENA